VARRFGLEGVVVLVALSKIGDIAAYYVGNAFGKSHPFPRISPGKTTAGCVASLVAGVALGAVAVKVGWLTPRGDLGLSAGLLAGLVVNLASQAGDLFESWVKRSAGVKDSSTWMGPAGGVLDVIDSLLLSVPAALLSWPLLFE
jgi:phosphatidate cytidylyltransferase